MLVDLIDLYQQLGVDVFARMEEIVMEARVSLVTLAVSDLERSAAFYEALGGREKTQEEGIVVFQLLGQVLGTPAALWRRTWVCP